MRLRSDTGVMGAELTDSLSQKGCAKAPMNALSSLNWQSGSLCHGRYALCKLFIAPEDLTEMVSTADRRRKYREMQA